MPSQPHPFCIDDLMLDLRHYVREELQKNGKPHIEADILLYSETDKCHLQADRNRIRQIFHILLDNAVANIERGFIIFGFYVLKNNVVDFFVDDTRLKRKKADDATNEDLTIARGLIEQMGSRLRVKPYDRLGSSLSFTVKGNTKMN